MPSNWDIFVDGYQVFSDDEFNVAIEHFLENRLMKPKEKEVFLAHASKFLKAGRKN